MGTAFNGFWCCEGVHTGRCRRTSTSARLGRECSGNRAGSAGSGGSAGAAASRWAGSVEVPVAGRDGDSGARRQLVVVATKGLRRQGREPAPSRR